MARMLLFANHLVWNKSFQNVAMRKWLFLLGICLGGILKAPE